MRSASLKGQTHSFGEVAYPPVNGGVLPLSRVDCAEDLLPPNVELFHTPTGEAFATFRRGGHRETWPVKSRQFARYLRVPDTGCNWANDRSADFRAKIEQLEAVASVGIEHPVFVRVAAHSEAIYLDLADADWQAVKVTPDGWEVTQDAPVAFHRTKGTGMLPVPEPGGSLADLHQLLSFEWDQDWVLLVSWLIGTFRLPCPILCLEGGSGCRTAVHLLRALVDPRTPLLRAVPGNEHNLAIAAKNSHILAFDPLKAPSGKMAAAIALLSSGAGFATRANYTDDEEVLFEAARPMILIGPEPAWRRREILDRAPTLRVSALCTVWPERELFAQLDVVRPRLLGAILDAVATALRNTSRSVADGGGQRRGT